jgi:hypothetical protein
LLRFNEFILQEKKDHLIKRLINLSDDEKKQVIDFFTKKPNLENKINWNNKNLRFSDFEPLMRETPKDKRKRARSGGLKGLTKGKDYLVIPNRKYTIYIPLSWEVSVLIASKDVGPCVGDWCTASYSTDREWKNHVYSKEEVMVYLMDDENKYAVAVGPNGYEIYDAMDERIYDIPGLNVKRDISERSEIQQAVKLLKNRWVEELPWHKKMKTKNAKFSVVGDTLLWMSGDWLEGTWKDGLWISGTWHKGTWLKGNWKTGTWKSGTWLEGTWQDGIWEKGIWKSGTWESGTWKSGTWLGGYDKDYKFHEKGDSPDKW